MKGVLDSKNNRKKEDSDDINQELNQAQTGLTQC